MSWDDGLSGAHLAIAGSESLRIGVLAGPGTGKTSYGLMRRLTRLLTEGADPRRVLLLSFTRVAAADLRDKVAELAVEDADQLRATTLHSYCFGLLQRDAVLAHTQRVPRILMDHEIDLMLRDIGGDYGNIYQRRKLLNAFVAGWARAAEDHPGVAELPEDKAFENAVLGWLRRHKAMLIGEVVPIAYGYLTQNPAADERRAFDHLIVDEYQDLNTLEQRLLDVLASEPGTALCIAGDDDQSIYQGLKYAHPEGILEYLDRPDTEAHPINTCGRCPRRILSMANSLIAATPGRDKPPLECLRDDEGSVAIVQWDSLEEEIEGIVAAITKDVRDERIEPGQILVLTGRRKIGEQIRQRLADLDIAAKSYFREAALQTPSSQEAIALLRLLVNRDDLVAWRVIFAVGDAGGRAGAVHRLEERAGELGLSSLEVLDRILAGDPQGVAVRALADRRERALTILDQLDPENLPEVIDRLFPDGDEARQELRDIALLKLPEVTSVDELLERIIEAITQDDVPQNPDFVRIMSLHKSKGLTCESVFIVGALDGIIPMITEDPGTPAADREIAEQRRLLYVGITRAAQQLVISSSRRLEVGTARTFKAQVVPNTTRPVGGILMCGMVASRYLRELGPDAPDAMRGVTWLEKY